MTALQEMLITLEFEHKILLHLLICNNSVFSKNLITLEQILGCTEMIFEVQMA